MSEDNVAKILPLENGRQITNHEVPGANSGITIIATDEPGMGGANHRYEVVGINPITNTSFDPEDKGQTMLILFQNGTIPEVGVNGITIEALLAIGIDRLEGFQSGKFACADNERALYHMREALSNLQIRTKNRVARGVEGKHVE